MKLKYLDGILQNLYLQWRKQSVLHGKMDGRLSLLMVAGQLSLSIPYWSLGMVQKYWRKFELVSCLILVRSESSIFPVRWLCSKSLPKCSRYVFLFCSSQLWFLSQESWPCTLPAASTHFIVLRSVAGPHMAKFSPCSKWQGIDEGTHSHSCISVIGSLLVSWCLL